ncbi:MAG: hypothetical protein ABI321_19220 [Polyangia bacterium]
MTLTSRTYEVDDGWAFLELAYEKGWTDGLPVAPPTPDRVNAMIAASGLPGSHVLGVVPPLQGKATVEKVAIQAVMAGCKPEYFRVVLTALACMLTESDNQTFNLRGVQDTTHSASPLVIVSGPVVKELDFHYKENSFGGGSRASSTVGRAIRLILWNLGGARPGETDMTHVGHPGKFSFCVAENPDDVDNPWTRLNEEHGYRRDQSTVTVFACEAPRNILVRPGFLSPDAAGTPENALRMIAHSMAATGSNNAHLMGQCLVAFGPRTAEFVMKAGWTKEKVRTYLFENARHRLGDLEKNGFWAEKGDARNGFWAKYAPWVDQTNRDTMVPVVEKPENIHIIVTGGGVLPVNAICNGWGCLGGYAVTKEVGVL